MHKSWKVVTYPDKQTVFRVWEEVNPYSSAFSFSSLVAVIILTGGDLGLGADTTSYITDVKFCYYE